MNINELLKSTERVKGYGSGELNTKEFGTVYAFNKRVKAKPKHSVVEISMMIKGKTDMLPSVGGSRKPVSAHLIKVAISGVKQDVLSGDELVETIRNLPKYKKKYADKKEYPKQDILKMAVEQREKYFEDKTIFKGVSPDTYIVMEDRISDKSQIRVWCSCSSFYWTFLYYNQKEGVCIQKRPPSKYVHKTQKGAEAFKRNKPLRNPNKAPGCCKHLMLLLGMLMDNEVIEANGKVPSELVREYKINVKKFLETKTLGEKGYKSLQENYKKDHSRKLEQRRIFSYSSNATTKKKKRKMWKGWNKKKQSFD